MARISRRQWLASCVLLPYVAVAAPITAGFEQWTERQTLSPAQMAELQALMASHATQSLAHLAAAKGDEQRFYALPAAAIGAYDLGRYEEARTLADELLAAVPRYTGNWNVGNAIHDGHMVLDWSLYTQETWPRLSRS